MKNKKSYKKINFKNLAKQRLFRLLFSRAGFILILLLVQLFFFFSIATKLFEHTNQIIGILNLAEIIVVVTIINSESSPEFKMTWVLFILTFPVFGILFYLYSNLQLGTRSVKNSLDDLNLETKPYMVQRRKILDLLYEQRPADVQLENYLSQVIGYPTYGNTAARYFPSGEEMLEEMLQQLSKARKFIFMEYFILQEGEMWDAILTVLRRKVQEGVEVRLMYDGMCVIDNLPYDYPKRMAQIGIKCKMSNTLRPLFTTVQNNRDHRKICVIDGKVAFTGGVNLADEYANIIDRFGYWKDVAIMLRGEAVQTFTMLFLQMWNVEEVQHDNFKQYVSPKYKDFHEELGFMIPYADSPFAKESVGEEVYLHIINHAKNYVHIMTPYLIIDNEMKRALCRASKSGVDIAIIMPHVPDKWYAFALAKTYYKELITAGVKIYEFTPGFVHAKVFVCDDETATVGTFNLDYRSMYLHFENGVYIYDNPVVYDIEDDFQNTVKKCHKVTVLEVEKRKISEKIAGQALRLLAPLM